MTPDEFRINERVKIFLDSQYWKSEGWFDGRVIRIDPYSEHRNFYWVELDQEVEPMLGKATRLVSILNPRNIQPLT
jgi:hypothetical protein